jgi:hypothetical protein
MDSVHPSMELTGDMDVPLQSPELIVCKHMDLDRSNDVKDLSLFVPIC